MAPAVGSFNDPPCPLPPELRSDIAYRRAQAHSWDAIGTVFHYHSDALRRATENDPDYAAAEAKAWVSVTWEGQADGMRRLRTQANHSDDEAKALKASTVLVEYAAEQRHDDARLALEKLRAENRLAVEKLRAEARLAVEKFRAERRASKAAKEDDDCAPMPMSVPYPQPKTEEEYAVERERNAIEWSSEETAEVYLWGGKHPLGRSVGPDESDRRVRVKPDWSCGVGGKWCPVLWVVPDPVPPEAYMPGDPGPVPAVAWPTH